MAFPFLSLEASCLRHITRTVAEGEVFCQVALATASDTVSFVLFKITLV